MFISRYTYLFSWLSRTTNYSIIWRIFICIHFHVSEVAVDCCFYFDAADQRHCSLFSLITFQPMQGNNFLHIQLISGNRLHNASTLLLTSESLWKGQNGVRMGISSSVSPVVFDEVERRLVLMWLLVLMGYDSSETSFWMRAWIFSQFVDLLTGGVTVGRSWLMLALVILSVLWIRVDTYGLGRRAGIWCVVDEMNNIWSFVDNKWFKIRAARWIRRG